MNLALKGMGAPVVTPVITAHFCRRALRSPPSKAIKLSDLNPVIVDTTVQPRNMTFPNRCQASQPRP